MNKKIKSINIRGSKIVVDLENGSQTIYPLSNYKGFTYNNYYFYYKNQKFSEINKTLQDFEDFLDGEYPKQRPVPIENTSNSDSIIISSWEEF